MKENISNDLLLSHAGLAPTRKEADFLAHMAVGKTPLLTVTYT